MKNSVRLQYVTGILLLALLLVPCFAFAEGAQEEAASKGTIVYADVSWDSGQVHNRIAAFILKHGYNYDADFVAGSTVPLLTGLMKGEINVYMESWTENSQELFDKGFASGDFVDLGANYPNAPQGWYVPTYMIKGDPARGIEATTPDLKSVFDLPKYREVFKDPEDPKKGRLYVGPPAWQCTESGQMKMEAYGLYETYNAFLPGSDAALSGSMVGAYKKGEPWLGYYWEPTWVLGMLDMTLLEEPEFSWDVWNETRGCEYPSCQVHIVVHKSVAEQYPDVVEFFKAWETTLADNNEFLLVMREEELSVDDAALWFLKNKPEVWTAWVSADTAAKVKAALD
jgi:glycine betaine/proline transport system substrate-binding protein